MNNFWIKKFWSTFKALRGIGGVFTKLHKLQGRVALYLPMLGECVGSPQNSIFPVGIELSPIVGM